MLHLRNIRCIVIVFFMTVKAIRLCWGVNQQLKQSHGQRAGFICIVGFAAVFSLCCLYSDINVYISTGEWNINHLSLIYLSMNQHTLLRLQNTDYLTTCCSRWCCKSVWNRLLASLRASSWEFIMHPHFSGLNKGYWVPKYLTVVTVRVKLFKHLCLIPCS